MMLDFGGNFNKSSFLFWLLEFTAVGFFTVGIEPFAAEKNCKKIAQKIWWHSTMHFYYVLCIVAKGVKISTNQFFPQKN